jgi:hypothetical protein
MAAQATYGTTLSGSTGNHLYHARRGDRLPGFVVEEGFSGAAGSVQGTETSQSGTDGEAARHGGAVADSPRQPTEAEHAELAERLAEMPAKEGASVE